MLLLTLIIDLINATMSNIIIIKQKAIKKHTLTMQIMNLATNSLIMITLTNRLNSERNPIILAKSS